MRLGVVLAVVAGLLLVISPNLGRAENIQVYVEDYSGNGASTAVRQTLARQFSVALLSAGESIKPFTRQDLRDLLEREEYKGVVACTESSCVTEITPTQDHPVMARRQATGKVKW